MGGRRRSGDDVCRSLGCDCIGKATLYPVQRTVSKRAWFFSCQKLCAGIYQSISINMKYFKKIICSLVFMASNFSWAINTISSDILWPIPSKVAVMEEYKNGDKAISMGYVITAEKGYNGIVLMFSDFKVKKNGGFVKLDKSVQTIIQPDLLVSDDGSPVRVFDFEDYQEAQYKMLHEGDAENSASNYSEEFGDLTKKMAFARWCSMVCAWRGVSLPVTQVQPVKLAGSGNIALPLPVGSSNIDAFVEHVQLNRKKQPALNISAMFSARVGSFDAIKYLQSLGFLLKRDMSIEDTKVDFKIKTFHKVVMDEDNGLPIQIETTHQIDSPFVATDVVGRYKSSRRFSLRWL